RAQALARAREVHRGQRRPTLGKREDACRPLALEPAGDVRIDQVEACPREPLARGREQCPRGLVAHCFDQHARHEQPARPDRHVGRGERPVSGLAQRLPGDPDVIDAGGHQADAGQAGRVIG
ncbi:MAG: hypothetical protein ACK559_00755, partial [bacterium]